MAGVKNRPEIGHDGTWTDRGPEVPPEALLTVRDKDHTLNAKFGLLDPTRYDLKHSAVQGMLATIRSSGPIGVLIVRLNGLLPRRHPITHALRELYPKNSAKPYLGEEQPAIEVLEGATRTWLTCLVNEERREKGLRPYKVTLKIIPNCTDEEARDIFLKAQADRQGNSFLQELALYRSYQRTGGFSSTAELAEALHQPAARVAEYAAFDGVEDAVAAAYGNNKVSLAQVRAIAKLPRAEQVAALAAPPPTRASHVVKFSAKQTLRLADRLDAAPDLKRRSFTHAEVVDLLRVVGGDQDARERLGDLAALLEIGGAGESEPAQRAARPVVAEAGAEASP